MADETFLDARRVVCAPADVAAGEAAARARGRVVPLRTPQDVRNERQSRPEPPRDPRAQEQTVPGPDGPLTLRVITPDGPVRAVRVVAHASGWCLGSATLDDAVGRALADSAGIAQVSVAYRLAPEHPFPAGLEDISAALAWTAENATPLYGDVPLVAAGASAGSHLTLLALLRFRAQRPDVLTRLTALDLRYGCYDLGQTAGLRAAGDDALITTSNGTAALLDHAFPGVDAPARRSPARSPLYADLRGLPPTLVSVGDLDGLLDDSAFLAARLAAAGVRTRLDVWTGCTHVFDSLSPGLRAEYVRRSTAWLDAHR